MNFINRVGFTISLQAQGYVNDQYTKMIPLTTKCLYHQFKILYEVKGTGDRDVAAINTPGWPN